MILTVLDQRAAPPKPLPRVHVDLSFLDGPQRITDASERTNDSGQIEMAVSQEGSERDLQIAIADVKDLVIFKPAQGLILHTDSEGHVLPFPSRLNVILVLKNSPALLEPDQIEALRNRLSIQINALQANLSKEQRRSRNIDVALRSWALASGLRYEQPDQHVRSWAMGVLAHRESASLTKQAEAELGLLAHIAEHG